MNAAIQACAEIVRRDDPHLHATALFAPEPARSRLMVLYAFDCELSRATRASRESMIPRMRLQWWRDVAARALGDGPAPEHEVAGPLTQLIRSDPSMRSDMEEFPGRDVLSQMIDGHEATLDAPFDIDAFTAWARARFGARLALAGSILPGGPDQGRMADRSVAGQALGFALACRTALRMVRDQGHCLLPDMRGPALTALARGELPDDAARALSTKARMLLDDLKALRGKRRELKGAALAAHLPLLRERRVLRLVARDAAAILGQIDPVDRPFQGLGLALAAWRGRW